MTAEHLRDAIAHYRDASPEDRPAAYDQLRAVVRALPPVEPLTSPCQCCGGSHRLVDCAGHAAAALLDAADLPRAAGRVRGRVVPARTVTL